MENLPPPPPRIYSPPGIPSLPVTNLSPLLEEREIPREIPRVPTPREIPRAPTPPPAPSVPPESSDEEEDRREHLRRAERRAHRARKDKPRKEREDRRDRSERRDRNTRRESQQVPLPAPPPGPPVIILPDFSTYTEAQLASVRTDLQIKFDTLRETWGDRMRIIEPPPEAPLDVHYAVYQRYLQQTQIKKNVADYKMYLIALFLGIEFVGTYILGLPLTNYTLRQLEIMSKYDSLLMELGEKNYTGLGSNWPVEIRILLVALVQAILFMAITKLGSLMGQPMAERICDAVVGFFTNRRSNAPQAPPVGSPENGPSGMPRADPPPAETPNGGFNISSIMNMLGGFMNGNNGGNNNNGGDRQPRRRAARRPTFNE